MFKGQRVQSISEMYGVLLTEMRAVWKQFDTLRKDFSTRNIYSWNDKKRYTAWLYVCEM